MSKISFQNVTISYPVHSGRSRSIVEAIGGVARGAGQNRAKNGTLNITALNGVAFEMNLGDRVAIIGGNGAGKSTLLRTVAGVYPPSRGTVEVEGSISSLLDLSLGINPEATGRENIFIRGQYLGLSRNYIRENLDEIVDFSEIGDFIDLPLRTYSSGMQLRLAFAISTRVNPEILIMDEWLSVGDESFIHKAESRLGKLVSETEILLIASHSRELVESVCNRAIWLEQGHIKMDGPVTQITKAYFG